MAVTAPQRATTTPGQRAPGRSPWPGSPAAGSKKLFDTGAGFLDQVAGMMLLTGKAAVATFTPPYSWRDEFIEESFLILRRCTIPMIISVFAFAFGAPGIQASNLTSI